MQFERNTFSGPRRSSGFTLLEVLLAFVVFAMSFTVVLEILSGSMRNTVHAREYTEAALIAQSVMDDLGLEIPLEPGTTAGGEEGAYTWELQVFPYSGEGQNDHSLELGEQTGIELLEAELVISWGTVPREQTWNFSTVKAVLASREKRS